ncbi:DUF1090 domain-containing protein [Roseateles sp. So40a]|uniref:DUF1090 domain-containing protein n=1 Tax=Roseateles sp. So40a TaxID=3400226 RepID=UPI003A87EDCE
MKRLFASILSLFCAASAMAAGEPSPACQAKRANIESQIAAAKAKGNDRRVVGLESALAANKRHCTDASLEAERQRHITAANKKVARREADLAAAQAKGDAKKIAKQQRQLDVAREELTEAQKPLAQ